MTHAYAFPFPDPILSKGVVDGGTHMPHVSDPPKPSDENSRLQLPESSPQKPCHFPLLEDSKT